MTNQISWASIWPIKLHIIKYEAYSLNSFTFSSSVHVIQPTKRSQFTSWWCGSLPQQGNGSLEMSITHRSFAQWPGNVLPNHWWPPRKQHKVHTERRFSSSNYCIFFFSLFKHTRGITSFPLFHRSIVLQGHPGIRQRTSNFLCMFGDKATTNKLEIKQQFSKMPRFKLMSSE